MEDTCTGDHRGIFSSLKKLLWHSTSNGNTNNNNIVLEEDGAQHPAALEPCSAEVACVPGVQVSDSALNSFPNMPCHIDGAVKKSSRKKRRKKLTLMGDLLRHKQLQTAPTSASENGNVNGSLDCSSDPAVSHCSFPECPQSPAIRSALNGHLNDAAELVDGMVPFTAYANGHGECLQLTAAVVPEPEKKRKRRSTVSISHAGVYYIMFCAPRQVYIPT